MRQDSACRSTEFLGRMDAELAAVVAQMPIRDYTDIPKTREMMARVLAEARAQLVLPPTVERSDHLVSRRTAPDVPVRVYRPIEQSGLPCLYWIHGGGHVLGSIDQDDATMCHLVDTVGCIAVSVDWRHAPEHPYPAELDDCYAGLLWTVQNSAQLGIDPSRIAVGGASSGGGTAAGIALRARDFGDVDLMFQLLIYPMLDDRNTTPSSHRITFPKVWNRTANLLAWRAYLTGDDGDDVPAYAAPSRVTDLSGLPPAFVAVGALDLFLDEDIDYAQRLLRAGVPTELHVYPGATHGFNSFAPAARVSRRLAGDRDDALRRAFQTVSGGSSG